MFDLCLFQIDFLPHLLIDHLVSIPYASPKGLTVAFFPSQFSKQNHFERPFHTASSSRSQAPSSGYRAVQHEYLWGTCVCIALWGYKTERKPVSILPTWPSPLPGPREISGVGSKGETKGDMWPLRTQEPLIESEDEGAL